MYYVLLGSTVIIITNNMANIFFYINTYLDNALEFYVFRASTLAVAYISWYLLILEPNKKSKREFVLGFLLLHMFRITFISTLLGKTQFFFDAEPYKVPDVIVGHNMTGIQYFGVKAVYVVDVLMENIVVWIYFVSMIWMCVLLWKKNEEDPRALGRGRMRLGA